MAYISILIPAYNCSGTIIKLLNSIPVRNDIEILVANDCSTDNTLEILNNYKTNKEIKILDFKINHGVGFIRNKLVKYSTGHWICWADSDDFFYTEELNKLFDKLYTFENFNKINIYARTSNNSIRRRGCEPWSSILKKEIYDWIIYPEIRSAEDWYFKKYLMGWYGDYIKEYNCNSVVYNYNVHEGSLYQQKKESRKNNNLEKFNYLEDPIIVKNYCEPIDIVVTYLNSESKSWLEQYNYWKDYEIAKGIQPRNNIQAFGEERIRGWGDSFKYWFRGVAKGAPWVRYIHLVCFDEDHVPDWLNTNHPKIKIHFHREFIPEKYLPTFNPILIYACTPYIENLSNYLITCDDDYYFLDYVPKEQFFNDGIPYGEFSENNTIRFGKGWGQWGKILNSSLDYLDSINDKPMSKIYRLPHLPSIEIKENELRLLKDGKILKSNSSSKFRNFNNLLLNFISYHDLVSRGIIKKSNILYSKSGFTNMTIRTDFDKYKDMNMACFNDSQEIKTRQEYEIVNKRLNEFLKKKLPEKCCFEK